MADVLHRVGIDYEHEPEVSGFRPDFVIRPWNLIVEFWGTHDRKHPHRHVKVKAYRREGYDLVNLEREDYRDLEQVLLTKLYRWDQQIFRKYWASSPSPPRFPSERAGRRKPNH